MVLKQLKLGCVVLAAGSAARFGANKLTAELLGQSLIRRALEAVPAERFDKVVVVTQYPEVMALAGEFRFAAVHNARPEEGLSRSVALGLTEMRDCDGVLFCVSDQPLLRRESVERLTELWRARPEKIAALGHGGPHHPVPPEGPVSQLRQWPVQIKLVPVEAPFFQGAKLLIAADCTAFSRADFHQRFIRGRITLIGCPKLDEGDYAEKLTEIIRRNDIREVTVVRMDVPCCGGIQRAAETALQNSGKFIPWQVVTLGRDGNILD